MRKLFLIIGILSMSLSIAASGEEDVWAPLRYFVGKWEGKAVSESSIGATTREYEFVFGGKYLQIKNKSVWEPSTAMPEGETHEDLGFFSYDRIRKLLVLRQFHIEGFVNQYALDSLSADSTTIVFVTEGIENIPGGWRAKEQYEILGENEFIELFKLAPPGQEFEAYTETHFTRVE